MPTATHYSSSIKSEPNSRSKIISYFLIRKLFQLLLASLKNFSSFHIKRDFNQVADSLASLGSIMAFKNGESCRSFEIGRLDQPAFLPTKQVHQAEQKKKPWYYNIKTFIETGKFPPELSKKEQRAIQRMSTRYFILANVLYRRGFSSEYCRCLDEDEAKEVVREAHEGICGGHVGYQTLVKQIIRAGYYWKTMQQDCYHYVKKCVQCQIHAPSIHAPTTYLQSVVSPWPFSMWAIRCRRSHHSFCFKWPQILPCRNRIFHQVGKSPSLFAQWKADTWSLLFTRASSADSASHMTSCQIMAVILRMKEMKTFCSKFKIYHHFSAPYYPQGNGQAEATNKILIRILERTVETGRDWHEKIHDALWAYRTTIRTPTNATPSELIYGTDSSIAATCSEARFEILHHC